MNFLYDSKFRFSAWRERLELLIRFRNENLDLYKLMRRYHFKNSKYVLTPNRANTWNVLVQNGVCVCRLNNKVVNFKKACLDCPYLNQFETSAETSGCGRAVCSVNKTKI